jgi:SpoVK/Ycf46/Vps4 family AAA+-type ATPase
MNWLSKGEVLERSPADMKGSVVGESERKTLDLLTAARGKVLLIDEAYGLGDGSSYMQSAVTTLVQKVQGVPGDDIAVLLLGYKDDMEEMLRYGNPGLARRFQPENAFVFEDYDNDALRVILLKQARDAGVEVPTETADAAIAIMARQRQKPNFGNGGAVANLLGTAKQSMARRQAEAADAGTPLDALARKTLIPEDFLRGNELASPEDALAGLVGADGARAKLEELRATVAAAQASGRDPWTAVEPCFVLKGPPGSGKTTLARALGAMFCALGLLADPDVVEKTASTLQTGYVGQAGLEVRKAFDEALGRVLLIDEAYLLTPTRSGHSYHDEIVAEIVACITSPRYKNKLIVVLAGYEGQMVRGCAMDASALLAR